MLSMFGRSLVLRWLSSVSFLVTILASTVSAASVGYSARGCSFAVTFPAAPKIELIRSAGQEFEQAQYVASDYFLRAECLVAAGVPDKEGVMDAIAGLRARPGARHAGI